MEQQGMTLSAAPVGELVTYTVTAYLIERPEHLDDDNLPEAFRERGNIVSACSPGYKCWSCREPIGWAYPPGSSEASFEWRTVVLTSTRSRHGVAALCGDCAPDSPAAPYADDPA